jgi:GTP-sensing pleiotropic transcriptional regulator CodY
MALTKEEIAAKLARRVQAKMRRDLTWGQLVAAVGGATPAEKDHILTALKAGDPATIGGLLFHLVNEQLAAEARAEVANALANNSLSLAELERVL